MKNIILILISIFFLYGCNEPFKEIPEDVVINYKNDIIEVYSDIKVKDLIVDSNVLFDNENDVINTNEIGEYLVNIYFTYKNKKYVDEHRIEIVDTTSPRIISGTNKTIYVGEDIDFCDKVFYGDNYDRSIDCKINGEYDINNPGSYELNITLQDDSKNVTDKKVILNVIEKPVIIENNKDDNKNNVTGILFEDIIKKYKNDNTMIGIDVSRWQKDIDFKKVKEAGCEFVIIRMGIQSDYDKEISLDANFEKNYEEAKNNNLLVGVYVYNSLNKTKDVKKQVNYVIKNLKNKTLDFPIAFDWENWSSWNKYKMNFYDINEIANKYINLLEKKGYKGMLYSSKFYLENIWTTSLNNPVWLAHYAENTNYLGDYFIWQRTDKGLIDGINGNVDVNILYKDKYYEIMGD